MTDTRKTVREFKTWMRARGWQNDDRLANLYLNAGFLRADPEDSLIEEVAKAMFYEQNGSLSDWHGGIKNMWLKIAKVAITTVKNK